MAVRPHCTNPGRIITSNCHLFLFLLVFAFSSYDGAAYTCGFGAQGSDNGQFRICASFNHSTGEWNYHWTDTRTNDKHTGPLTRFKQDAYLELFVSLDGSRFAVLDAFVGTRLNDRLVIYASDGAEVQSIGAADILNDAEFRSLPQTDDHLTWIEPGTTYIPTQDALRFRTLQGRSVFISLKDGSTIPPAFAGDPDVPALIHYTWRDALLSNIDDLELRVRADGDVWFRYHEFPDTSAEYSYSVDEAELDKLQALAGSVGVLNQPIRKPRGSSDVGETVLMLNLDDGVRTIIFDWKKELEPLTDELQKLVNQAMVTLRLTEHGDIYAALGACDPHLAGNKVHRPEWLLEPMKSFVVNCDDWQKIGWGIEGLAWITTPQEWLEILEADRRTASPERKKLYDVLLSSQPFRSNLPTSHVDTLPKLPGNF